MIQPTETNLLRSLHLSKVPTQAMGRENQPETYHTGLSLCHTLPMPQWIPESFPLTEATPDHHLTTHHPSLGALPTNLSTKAKVTPFVSDVEPQPQTNIPVPSINCQKAALGFSLLAQSMHCPALPLFYTDYG